MNIEYTWDIQSLHVVPSLGDEGYTNIIKEIYWSLTAITEEFVSDFITDVAIVDIFSDKSNFIDYSDLTKETIISWIHEILGEEKIDNMKKVLENRIQSKVNHPTVIFELPWIKNLPKETIDLESSPQLLLEPEIEEEIIYFPDPESYQPDNSEMGDDPYGILAQAEFELEMEALSKQEITEEISNSSDDNLSQTQLDLENG